ncbi:MAG: EamA family transporter [Lachnospiraceae bacterium]|nr:EamA family transporter [Lachnospiraceae bacterium]
MNVVISVLSCTCIASFASYFLKKSSSTDNKLKILLSPWFYLGGILYVISACINIYLLQLVPYAVAMPLGSLTYVWTMFVSNRLLGEAITKKKIIGMLVIFAGVVCVAAGH